MTPAALRIVNKVSYVMMITQASHFVDWRSTVYCGRILD